ncbi:acyl-CoA/acyl-ACP dehydrogenase [Mannheimia sp. AT1]|uniref:Acyl-CoA/acyl-ACP dehydrogenase n=1 Tax=Mannheimia cairinae TaxID=3025936 RepID=A0ABT5MPK4_9PAST|nr:acyl-CoA dehydrogenase family protein [Mannheimia cairinae]MDD0824110.1 acyl-CoA/acyl-ACP dehydrogenase [Mannheimia cairinae]MDD0826815.1 acyl-CoA/acyl-ACP dehydrogenase [Mannheimia cairinae]
MSVLSTSFIEWLQANAESLDQSNERADLLISKIAAENLFKVGVPTALGGNGGNLVDAIKAIAELGNLSLSAAFVSWGHRTFIEHIIASKNPVPRDTYLADLLQGTLTAGTGLSNAMKFLSGIEELNVSIREENGKRYLNGRLPWVTNLRAERFVASFVAGFEDERNPIVIAIPSTAEGLTRTKELEFIALQGTNTTALVFEDVELKDEWILSDNAPEFLAETRPAFLGLQFGLPFGLVEKSLSEIEKTLSFRSILAPEWQAQVDALNDIKTRLFNGLNEEGYFVKHPKELFKVRIEIVDVVAQTILLELQASGGRGYLKYDTSGFSRRWKEAAFLPVVTPSAVQLRLVLANS